MKIPLAQLARQTTRRKSITLREIEPLRRDQDALQRIYLEVVRHWEGARGRLVEAYGRELAVMESAGTFDSIDDMQDAIDTEASWFANVFLSLEVQITAWTATVERWHRDRWARIAQPYIPSTVNLNTLLTAGDVQQTLEATIKGNLALIRDVNEQTRSKMAEAIFRGLNQRLPARDVAKELSTITGFARKRTLLIASVELQKLTTALDSDRMAQAGITDFVWRHSRKRDPRLWHQAREGKRYNLLTRKQSDGNGDETIPADDMPGIPIRCGCKKAAYLKLDDVEDD